MIDILQDLAIIVLALASVYNSRSIRRLSHRGPQ